MEKQVVSADIRRANWGLIAGFVISLAFGAGSFIAVLSGYRYEGLGLGGGTLAALVGVFVYGTSSRRAERRERVEMFGPLDD